MEQFQILQYQRQNIDSEAFLVIVLTYLLLNIKILYDLVRLE
jgi:hypothetical protein